MSKSLKRNGQKYMCKIVCFVCPRTLGRRSKMITRPHAKSDHIKDGRKLEE